MIEAVAPERERGTACEVVSDCWEGDCVTFAPLICRNLRVPWLSAHIACLGF